MDLRDLAQMVNEREVDVGRIWSQLSNIKPHPEYEATKVTQVIKLMLDRYIYSNSSLRPST